MLINKISLEKFRKNYPTAFTMLACSNMLSLVSILPFACSNAYKNRVDRASNKEKFFFNLPLYLRVFGLILNSIIVNGLIFGGIGYALSSKLDEALTISFAASFAFAIVAISIYTLSQEDKKLKNGFCLGETAFLGATTPVGLILGSVGAIVDCCSCTQKKSQRDKR